MKIKLLLTGSLLSAMAILPGAVSAQTTGNLQAQITALLKQIAALQAQIGQAHSQSGSGAPACHIFSINLRAGATGTEVIALQTALAADGETVPSTGFFGPLTNAAVTKFQEKYAAAILTPNGLSAGTGLVGAATRAKLNALQVCNNEATPPFTPIPAPNPAPVPIATGTPAPTPVPVIIPVPAPASTGQASVNLTTPHGGSNHIKKINDELGSINFNVSGGGPIAINSSW